MTGVVPIIPPAADLRSGISSNTQDFVGSNKSTVSTFLPFPSGLPVPVITKYRTIVEKNEFLIPIVVQFKNWRALLYITVSPRTSNKYAQIYCLPA